ncbi:MAG: response regulator transcription factor [Cyclobacteriaceae bacterium]|nr:MAG: response regulator transcription factor [Cyclobacteriaceae bacterium]
MSTKTSDPKRILLVDDHPVVLAGLFSILKPHFPSSLFFFARNGVEALEILRLNAVDIMIMDVSMPEMDGYDLIKAVTRQFPILRIIVIAQSRADAMIKFFLQYRVSAILLKSRSDTIGTTVQEVWKLGYSASSEHVGDLARSIRSESKVPLTPQSRTLIKLIAEGKASKLIADEMNLSENTVNSYRQKLLRQTRTKNTVELVAFAFKNGLLE